MAGSRHLHRTHDNKLIVKSNSLSNDLDFMKYYSIVLYVPLNPCCWCWILRIFFKLRQRVLSGLPLYCPIFGCWPHCEIPESDSLPGPVKGSKKSAKSLCLGLNVS